MDKSFENWYLIYDKDDFHDTKQMTFAEWVKLSRKEQSDALLVVSDYVESTPNKRFRKHPANYLREKRFNRPCSNFLTTCTQRGSDAKAGTYNKNQRTYVGEPERVVYPCPEFIPSQR